MKALFIHDHIFSHKKLTNEVYSPGGLPANVWKRYLYHFESLTVVGRGVMIPEANSNLIRSDHANVKFDLFYNVRGGFDYYKFSSEIKNTLNQLITSHDAVIIRLPSTLGSFAADICIKQHKKYIVEVVGCAWDINWHYGSLIVKCMAVCNYFRTKKYINNSFASIYVTKRFLQNRYPSKGLTSYASNVNLKAVDEDILTSHLTLLQKDRTLQFGMIGNLNMKYKGYHVIMKALNLLNKDFSDYKLYLVGGGDSKYVQGLIKKYNLQKNVQIVGRLQSGNEIFEFLDKLNLYIHPSLTEGLPRSVIEAMSRACPVLASSVAGIPELIDRDYLHNPGNYKQLYKQLKDIYSNKPLLVEMAQVNFKNAIEYYSENLEERRKTFFSNVKNKIQD